MRVLRHLRFLRSKLAVGGVLGVGLVLLGHRAGDVTSSDAFCVSCHAHPQAGTTWKRSTHFDNKSGVVTRCVECHLPPPGIAYWGEKIVRGTKDVVGTVLGDPTKIDWEERSLLENAVHHTFEASCLRCHRNLFPIGLSQKGGDAHLHYTRHREKVRCINCHLHVGHYSEKAKEAPSFGLEATAEAGEIFTAPARAEGFADFEERIPGTRVAFDMVAIPGGEFDLGSPANEPTREGDEGPVRRVRLSPFWIGRCEVTWNEYEAFYRATASARPDAHGRQAAIERREGVDGISGATPPYGSPDQGWGKGTRPAITMTHHAAMTYCRWLSSVTGKTYRLPTEAEWEYACRGGTAGPYFFEGSPRAYTRDRLWNRLFGAATEPIGKYVIYAANARGRTQPPDAVRPNPFGLLHTAGNVREFCLDWYAPEAYAQYPEGEGDTIVDPRGPASGTEHVVRGGSFRSDASEVRSAARDRTRHDAWLMTDPQVPKSLWWYSDCIDVGFRVVCEFEGESAPGGTR